MKQCKSKKGNVVSERCQHFFLPVRFQSDIRSQTADSVKFSLKTLMQFFRVYLLSGIHTEPVPLPRLFSDVRFFFSAFAGVSQLTNCKME